MRALIAANEGCALQVCVYRQGKVIANLAIGEYGPIDPRTISVDTLFNSFSCGKAVCALLVHIMCDQGWISSLDDLVADYWPVFAEGGAEKASCTVRMLLEHRSGLSVGTPVDAGINQLCQFDEMVDRIARGPLTEACGTSKYHTMTYGWLVGGFVQAVAAKEQLNFSYSQLVKSFITEKLGIEDHCMTEIPRDSSSADGRLGSRSHERIASVTADSQLTSAASSAHDIFSQLGSMDSSDSRRIAGFDPRIFNDAQIREACIPSCNTHFSAYGLATIYAALAHDGSVHGRRVLSADYTARLKREVEKAPHQKESWPLGFRKFRHAGRAKVSAFGFNGISNLTGLADPATGTSVAIMVNQVSPKPTATASLLHEVCSELKSGEIVWPNF